MNRRNLIASLIALGALSASASADFANGNPIGIFGTATAPVPGVLPTTWGGTHQLGGNSIFDDVQYPGQGLVVGVTSTVVNPNVVMFSIDFSHFHPSDYGFYTIDLTHLKADGSIISVTSSQGHAVVVGGNDIHWEGLGSDLVADPKLRLTIEQPAPGALALLGFAGLVGARRRRI